MGNGEPSVKDKALLIEIVKMFVKFDRKFGKPTVPVESAAFHLDTK